MDRRLLENKTIGGLLSMFPYLINFFEDQVIETKGKEELTLKQYIEAFDQEEQEDRALDYDQLMISLAEYIDQMQAFLGEDDKNEVESISILPGTNKFGETENFDELTIRQSEIICIVGPTGSGKSRLLGDIEWVAKADTPTKRSVLINGEPADNKYRFSSSHKLVAQLSQNMNFVMDLSVGEFIELHAKSRLVENEEEVIKKIFEAANHLAGEPFKMETPITSLSGGQSRALMIADTAILSKSPIILIDEIENAGIDRKKALQLLVGEEKIVLMATHDPILALMGDKRVVIKNGGIHKIIETSDEERSILSELEEMDNFMLNMRTKLRHGEVLSIDAKPNFVN
jgi:ABC-type lipoprotein export system ATPase subunit